MLSALILTLKLIAIGIWFMVGSLLATIFCVVRWGNLDNDHYGARIISRPILWIAGWRLEIEGVENLHAHQPCIYAMNHQSNMDAFIAGSMFPRRTIIIGKKSIAWLPFFGQAFMAGGNILLDRKNRAAAIRSLGRAVLKLRDRNVSIFIFPEGTRNKSAELLQPFKKGAFHMAVEAQVPVVSIACQPTRPLFDWPKKHFVGGTVRLRVLPPVHPGPVGPSGDDSVNELSNRVRERLLEAIRGLAARET